MGQDVRAQKTEHNEYIDALFEFVISQFFFFCKFVFFPRISTIVHERQKKPWLWSDLAHNLIGHGHREQQALRTLHDFTDRVIGERYAELEHVGGELSINRTVN